MEFKTSHKVEVIWFQLTSSEKSIMQVVKASDPEVVNVHNMIDYV